MKKIAIMTSGGDAQGMNAAIYSSVKYAVANGIEVYGIPMGFRGLIDGKIFKMSANEVVDIINKGGTVLKTARCLEMKTEEGQLKAVKTLKDNGIEGLIVIGGDGSFQGAKVLSTKYGIKVIGIPGTIDNDLAYTDFTLGFDSAVSVCVDTVNMLRDTMASNDRSCVVEVMGRHCGDIAMYSALTTGAEIVLLPEVKYDIDQVVEQIQHNCSVGKFDNIIIVAEGAGSYGTGVAGNTIMEQIKARIPTLNIRCMIVGHIQRGGNATYQDTLLGIRMGARAVECLIEGKTDRVIGIKNDKIFDEDMLEALAKTKVFNTEVYNLVNKLSKF